MITVFGATGNVGSRVLARLAGTDVAVRAVGRGAGPLTEVARRHGAEPVVADLADPASLPPALDGADAAFLVFPSASPDVDPEAAVAAITARVRRVVYLSTHGAPDDPADTTDAILRSHARIESLLRASGAEWTFLRASGFATNTLAWAPQVRAGDAVRWFGPGITRALVHEDDLAAVGVRALTEGGHAGAAHHLTGPQQLTQAEQVATLGEVLGRPLRLVDVGPEEAPSLFVGMDPDGARAIVRAQLAMLAEPEEATGEVERLLGRPAATYAQWVHDHREAFGG